MALSGGHERIDPALGALANRLFHGRGEVGRKLGKPLIDFCFCRVGDFLMIWSKAFAGNPQASAAFPEMAAKDGVHVIVGLVAAKGPTPAGRTIGRGTHSSTAGAISPVVQPESNLESVGMVGSCSWNFSGVRK